MLDEAPVLVAYQDSREGPACPRPDGVAHQRGALAGEGHVGRYDVRVIRPDRELAAGSAGCRRGRRGGRGSSAGGGWGGSGAGLGRGARGGGARGWGGG